MTTFLSLLGSHLARGLFCFISVSSGPLLSAATPPVDLKRSSPLMRELPERVREAELIIVGKVEGMVDAQTGAEFRRAREAHRVLAQATLQGYDESGRTLVVKPQGVLFADGSRYILFLRRLEGNYWEAQGDQLVAATEENIAEVKNTIAQQGAGVLPARMMWMTYSSGWERAPVAEFLVGRSGTYEWRQRVPDQKTSPPIYQELSGVLPEPALQNLIDKIENARPGRLVDDAGMVVFNWVNVSGQTMTKTYFVPTENPAAELLAGIAELAKSHQTAAGRR